ncbi:T9SS type A sorting domain-containing protein [Vicingaceae bacterium]|nr:T9SS type A sorting domain-containing protein [Vicingaceae bacterium]
MDSLGNLKTGFGIRVVNPKAEGLPEVNNLNNVALYPYPATNQITLGLTSIQNNLNVRVMDISGRVVIVHMNQSPGTVTNFDIAYLESGLYFIVLNNGSSQEIKKFIKQ